MSVVGAYLVDVVSEAGQASPRGVVTFASGGVLSAIASDVPNTTFLGEWTADGDDGFVGTYLSFAFNSAGGFDGTAEISITGKVIGDRLRGTYTATGKSPDGGELFPPDRGTFEGLRILPHGGNI